MYMHMHVRITCLYAHMDICITYHARARTHTGASGVQEQLVLGAGAHRC